MKLRFIIPLIIVLALVAGFFVYPLAAEKLGFNFPSKPFKFGLDIKGGTHLVYQADLSKIPPAEQDDAMSGLKDVIERRVNLFGVSEPLVTVNRVGENRRLIVELAGILDVNEAIRLIGATPFLEFRELSASEEIEGEEPVFVPTGLTGRFLKTTRLGFESQTNQPIILLEFNKEGAALFAELTKANIGRPMAIYLDGLLLSAPIVNQEITGGSAQITGQFSVAEAKELVRDLNAGALPVPIELISQQTIGATLGEESLAKGLFAGFVGFALVAIFMILYYRLAGVVSVVALFIYVLVVLSIFKLIPVTLTLAGMVGFILSIGMAVDANILIFERMKEEFRAGRSYSVAMEEGFRRAWTAIRDAYTSTFMTAIVLYWFGTSLVRGFALTLALGLLMSLFSAIVLTRTFMRVFGRTKLRDNKFFWKH